MCINSEKACNNEIKMFRIPRKSFLTIRQLTRIFIYIICNPNK
jgi:hypothetical protein